MIIDVFDGKDAPRFYRALAEATVFGSRAILERFREEGVPIDRALAVGGVARKSSLVMRRMDRLYRQYQALGGFMRDFGT